MQTAAMTAPTHWENLKGRMIESRESEGVGKIKRHMPRRTQSAVRHKRRQRHNYWTEKKGVREREHEELKHGRWNAMQIALNAFDDAVIWFQYLSVSSRLAPLSASCWLSISVCAHFSDYNSSVDKVFAIVVVVVIVVVDASEHLSLHFFVFWLHFFDSCLLNFNLKLAGIEVLLLLLLLKYAMQLRVCPWELTAKPAAWLQSAEGV